MNEAFKLLVTAVAALALIWVFMTYLVPMLFPATPIRNVLASGFESAQGMEGKLLTKPVGLRRGSALTADVLDSAIRSVNFRCTDAVQCCQQQQISPGCKVAIDDRMLMVEQDGTMQVGFRCTYEQNIYLCSAYFGHEPAQLEVTGFRAPKDVELGSGPVVLAFTVKNTGKLKAMDVIATAKAYKRVMVDGLERELLHSGPVNRSVEEIAPNKAVPLTLPLEVREPGTYKLRLEVRGIEAGQVVQETLLKVMPLETAEAAALKCRVTVKGRKKVEPYGQGEPYISHRCLQEYLCEGCTYDYECKLAWEKKMDADKIVDWSLNGVWAWEQLDECLDLFAP